MQMEDVVSGAAGLAGIQWLLHGEMSRQLLCSEVRSLLPASTYVQACRLLRAKVKPERKVTAYYALTLFDEAKGNSDLTGNRVQRPIAVTWTLPTGEPAKSHGRETAHATMERAAVDAGLAAPFLRLHSYQPTTGMAIDVSPFDPSFPHLPAATTPQQVAALLTTHLASSDRHILDQAYTVNTIRYRPRQRHVLCYAPHSAQATCFYAKLYDHDNSGMGEVASWTNEQLVRGASFVRALPPAAWVAPYQLALYPAVPGVPLRQLLMQKPAPLSWLHQAGIALRTCHNAATDELPPLPHQDLAGECKAIQRAGEHLLALAPPLYHRLTRLLQHIEEQTQTDNSETTFTHRDFKADHLFVTANGLVLLDFDSCALGDPAVDVGKFLADLHWWHHFGAPFDLQQARHAFLDGYGGNPQSDRMQRAWRYAVLWLVKNSLRRLNRFEADWLAQTQALFAQAETLFATRNSHR